MESADDDAKLSAAEEVVLTQLKVVLNLLLHADTRVRVLRPAVASRLLRRRARRRIPRALRLLRLRVALRRLLWCGRGRGGQRRRRRHRLRERLREGRLRCRRRERLGHGRLVRRGPLRDVLDGLGLRRCLRLRLSNHGGQRNLGRARDNGDVGGELRFALSLADAGDRRHPRLSLCVRLRFDEVRALLCLELKAEAELRNGRHFDRNDAVERNDLLRLYVLVGSEVAQRSAVQPPEPPLPRLALLRRVLRAHVHQPPLLHNRRRRRVDRSPPRPKADARPHRVDAALVALGAAQQALVTPLPSAPYKLAALGAECRRGEIDRDKLVSGRDDRPVLRRCRCGKRLGGRGCGDGRSGGGGCCVALAVRLRVVFRAVVVVLEIHGGAYEAVEGNVRFGSLGLRVGDLSRANFANVNPHVLCVDT
eukprot:Opistho-1_new@56453